MHNLFHVWASWQRFPVLTGCCAVGSRVRLPLAAHLTWSFPICLTATTRAFVSRDTSIPTGHRQRPQLLSRRRRQGRPHADHDSNESFTLGFSVRRGFDLAEERGVSFPLFAPLSRRLVPFSLGRRCVLKSMLKASPKVRPGSTPSLSATTSKRSPPTPTRLACDSTRIPFRRRKLVLRLLIQQRGKSAPTRSVTRAAATQGNVPWPQLRTGLWLNRWITPLLLRRC